jgi:acyl transferase domain-containing protein
MEAIAVVGFAFKLPGAEDAASFWGLLQDGRNQMTEWPESRINIDGFHDVDTSRKNVVSTMGSLIKECLSQ